MFDAAGGPRKPRNPAVLSPAIAALFAPGIVAAELRERGEVELLAPSEAAYCAHFAPKRRAEFAAGRLCARRVLAELGFVDAPLAANPDRSPRWPSSLVGSITHTDGFAAAVVAEARSFTGLGIDAETIGRVTPELWHLIFTDTEAELLDSFAESERSIAATVIFSAKEAFYKCQYPVTHAWRDFRDASLELRSNDMRAGDFIVRPARTTAIREWGVTLPLHGRFMADAQRVVTAISLTAQHDVATATAIDA